MKIRILSAVLLMGCCLYGFAQKTTKKQTLEPTPATILADSTATVNVLVTNLKDKPTQGDKISFVSLVTKQVYSGVSDENGRFTIELPKGEAFEVRFLSLGKDSVLRTLPIPPVENKVTMNYTIKYELPRTLILDNVYFDTNKTTLKPASFVALDNLVELLKYKSSINMEIAGHTDNVGSAESNMRLSQGRADVVKAYLVKKGIKEERLTAKGYGLSMPIDTNDTPEGRANNRRTEAHILGE
ncbi:MAG: OmpA family protein [Prevotellaceae bacterium]|jgi:outer membrane protein OmpA-like peptidoglycan-associated protein|nr:OmpA family protein [Prevotellaceae bacterium]